MKIYGIKFEDGSMDEGPVILEDHLYLSREIAELIRDQLYATEIERKRRDLRNSGYLLDEFEKEIKNGWFGNLNPEYMVVELEVKE